MKKVIIIGCCGSGKSTFARHLHACTGIPLFHLDQLNWNENKTTVEKEVFLKRVQDVIQKDSWIIDGNYGSSIEMRMQACDTVFFLDYPVDICIQGIHERVGKVRTDIPWVEDEVDEDLIEFVIFRVIKITILYHIFVVIFLMNYSLTYSMKATKIVV